ncbi:HNH endonuclease [Salmonella enterica subsp. enterica serovar Livingstone]|uniref:HNH endonuclease n=3 Tax=Salmonella enterica TaxID=28901 RepID=A0A764QGX9_SALER|nr:HNH endonuclease [Salmonella enterica]EBC1702337.1 HNH endonuclease [Salmonella enterica subsp. enterica]ECI2491115.1 HNH endonuclease [Salmonella enterica subsp. enterica serovar Enteritidis]EAA3793210.1 HNH endonuclease [Salmonella enterica subsp. enterica serovar Livingstone]EAC0854991.1 HNH endonuclease [Salmonella enterica subsp. enterica serovar Livingstone]EBH8556496.1 HNH endonuclease [Salmonella enterica subsp. enterica serovar Livingstone]
MSTPEDALLELAWYLSKFGKDKPPSALGVDKWKDVAALFYPRFGVGKTSVEFYNSLKNHRDRFDSWLSDSRTGWRNQDGTPRSLPITSQRVLQRMNKLPESVIEHRILSQLATNPLEQTQQDILFIQQDKSIDATMRQQLIAARLGQGYFRKKCLELYPTCPVTNISFEPLLRASHIKPWAACHTGKERLDPFNGIMLAAHIDLLFDQGWLSFNDDGEILLSNELNPKIASQLELPKKIKKFPLESIYYLEWHRKNILR